MLDFRIILEARNSARRCWRQYRVEAGTDLFGVWVVDISYGRIGTAGRSRSYVVRDEGEARHLAQSILKRNRAQGHRIKIGGLGRMANSAFGGKLNLCGTCSHLCTMFVVYLVVDNKYNVYVR